MSEPHASTSEDSPIEARIAGASSSEADDRYSGHRAGGMTRPARSHLTDSRAAVLLTLFLVAGAFGIPLLWISGKFSRRERIVWTILATLYTLGLIVVLVVVVRWMYLRWMPTM